MQFNITAEDILKAKIIDKPGWQHAVIADWVDTTAKSSGVSGVECTFRILDGPDKGVCITERFWENAPGFIIPLLEAVSGKKMEQKAQTLNLTKEGMTGKFVDIETKRGEYNNRPQNQIVNYKPFSGTKPTA